MKTLMKTLMSFLKLNFSFMRILSLIFNGNKLIVNEQVTWHNNYAVNSFFLFQRSH